MKHYTHKYKERQVYFLLKTIMRYYQKKKKSGLLLKKTKP